MSIDEKMKQLADARAAVDLLRMDMRTMMEGALTDEQRAVMVAIEAERAAIEEEFTPLIEAAKEVAERAEAVVKAAVINLGRSHKCAGLNAVYSKPRVKWDTKAIDGYALNHPELFAFRSEGEPSVSIRVVK